MLSQHQTVLSDKLCGSVEVAATLCAHLRDLEEERLSISAIELWVEDTCKVGDSVAVILTHQLWQLLTLTLTRLRSFVRCGPPQDMAQLRAQALFLHKVVREDLKARGSE